MTMRKFKIDFFELMFLAEVCSGNRPIARSMFFNDIINEYYHEMSVDERSRAFDWLVNKNNLDLTKSNNNWFALRFHPNNQYLITTKFEGKLEKHEAFLKEDRYYTKIDVSLIEDYIIEIKKL